MRFQQIFSQFQKQHMLIIGDAIVDSYFSGITERLCREAPVPIVNVEQRTQIPGGAANTAVNCATLGAKTTFISVTGKDKEADNLLQNLRSHAIDVSWVQQDEKRQTLTKNRISAGTQLLVRYDYGTTDFITEETEIAIIDALIDVFPQCDGVIISDYGYGIFTPNVMYTVKKLQEKFPKIIVVDSKHVDHFKNIGITAIKPNYEETTKLLGIPHLTRIEQRLEQIMEYGPHILDMTNTKIAAITLDVDGALIFEKGKAPFRTYTKPTDNTKAIGAGDTYTSALALSLTTNATTPSAAEIASAAAMITIRKEGTTSCYLPELLDFFSEDSKEISSNQLQQRIERLKQEGKQIVFTNGCFDILHRGHITYLSKAKSLGDVLLVGVNTDESIQRLKGSERPINTLEDRMLVLSALSCIDYIVPFKDSTPLKLIKAIQPDIYVKGGDYTKETLPEAPIVEAQGGKVEILPYISDYSTTDIIKHIRHDTNQTEYPQHIHKEKIDKA